MSLGSSCLLHVLGEYEDLYMAVVLLLANVWGTLSLLPYYSAQLLSTLLFGPTRTLQCKQ